MCLIHQSLEIIRVAVRGGACVRKNTVITPVTSASEGSDRHQLDGCDAQRGQVIEAIDDPKECAFRGEGSDVELVDDAACPRPTFPPLIPPPVCSRIDKLAH